MNPNMSSITVSFTNLLKLVLYCKVVKKMSFLPHVKVTPGRSDCGVAHSPNFTLHYYSLFCYRSYLITLIFLLFFIPSN